MRVLANIISILIITSIFINVSTIIQEEMQKTSLKILRNIFCFNRDNSKFDFIVFYFLTTKKATKKTPNSSKMKHWAYLILGMASPYSPFMSVTESRSGYITCSASEVSCRNSGLYRTKSLSGIENYNQVSIHILFTQTVDFCVYD